MKLNLSPAFYLSLLVLSYCHSKDFGDAPADRVQMDPTLVDWDHGVKEVIQLKCANCHMADRPQSVPGNTPHSIDGMSEAHFFTNEKNKGYIKAMKKRVESEEAGNVMPPNFATPLYPEERSALIAFLDQSLKSFDATKVESPTPTPTPTPIPNGEPPSPTPTPPNKLMWVDIKPIAMASCAKGGCHDGIDTFPLTTCDEFANKMPSVLNEILDGYMPLDDDTFKDSTEGKKMIQWLSSGHLE